MANCPMCGEPWSGLHCESCEWYEPKNTPQSPRWWRQCLSADHAVSILEKGGGAFEFFCGDCNDGAGKGEVRRV